jgi:hypothetical protein
LPIFESTGSVECGPQNFPEWRILPEYMRTENHASNIFNWLKTQTSMEKNIFKKIHQDEWAYEAFYLEK